jgi:hypothetical protein
VEGGTYQNTYRHWFFSITLTSRLIQKNCASLTHVYMFAIIFWIRRMVKVAKKKVNNDEYFETNEYNAKPNLQSRARLCSSDRSHRSLVFLIPFTHHTAHRVPTPFSLPFFFHFPFLILTKVCCCTDITCIRFLYEKLSITIIIKIVCNFYLEKLYVWFLLWKKLWI